MPARQLLAATCIALLLVVPTAIGGSTSNSVPRARIGMNYFDGWSGPLSSAHFQGLVRSGPNGRFPGRRPLSGWRDASRAGMRVSLDWARQDGVDFFYFDWYYHPGLSPSLEDRYLNTALGNYLKLADHRGVGAALMYVNVDQFTVPQSDWQSVVEKWVTEDFLNPDYARVDGKPLLLVIDAARFNEQWGGTVGVNSALETLQRTAIAHGHPCSALSCEALAVNVLSEATSKRKPVPPL